MPAESISRPMVGFPQKRSFAKRLAKTLYERTRQAQRPVAESHPDGIKVVCISDTHNTKPSPLPPGDILIHGGDLSQFGTFPEVQAQLTWLLSQDHTHKIVIAGNHDLLLDRAFVAAHPDRELDKHPGQTRDDLVRAQGSQRIHYLENEAITLGVSCTSGATRRLSIFGSPWTPKCGSWAFQYDASVNNACDFTWKGAIPDNADIVVVHGPPKGHLDDGGKGCDALLEALWKARPAVVVCGHIHQGRGEEKLLWDMSQRWYDNVMLGQGTWASLLCLTLYYLWSTFRERVGWARVTRNTRCTHLINASVTGKHIDGGEALTATV